MGEIAKKLLEKAEAFALDSTADIDTFQKAVIARRLLIEELQAEKQAEDWMNAYEEEED